MATRGQTFIPPQALLDTLGLEGLVTLARRFHVSQATLVKLRRQHGIRVKLGRPAGYRKPYIPSPRDLQIKKRFKAGETLEQIGVRFGLTRERVRQIAKAQKLKARGLGHNGMALRKAAEERCPTGKMIALYAKGLSCEKIGIKLGVSHHAVFQRLKRRGVKMRHWSDYAKLIDKAALEKAYNRGLSFRQLAEMFGLSAMGIHHRIVIYGFKLRGAGRWKEQRKLEDIK